MKTILILFVLLNSLDLSFSKALKYQIVFEYLYSDMKDSFDIELYNRPKTPVLDFGEEIFYSGNIEKIENFPIDKLVNFTKEDFDKNKKNEEEPINKKEERKPRWEHKYPKEPKNNNEENINRHNKKNEKEKKEKESSENDYDMFDDIFFQEPLIRRIFDNDYNKYIKFIKDNYLNNHYTRHNPYQNNKNKENGPNKEEQKDKNYQFQRPYVKIIQPGKGHNAPTIKIINYPSNDRYKTTIYNNQYDPYHLLDEFDNFDFGFNDIFQSIEADLNKIYRVRFLSENGNTENNNDISKQKIFSLDKHNIVYISNKLYYDYIKYLPKSTIILTPIQFAKELQNYHDYYIFTVKDGISLSAALAKSENTFYKVKIGQNFENSNLILISLSVTVFFCLLGAVLYTYLLKHNEEDNILPVQKLVNRFPQYLCLLNILMYFSFIGSYGDSDGYFIIVKYVCLFLYSLFKSFFLCIIILLLNGWMTLSFKGWAKKLNRVIPIILFEILTSVAFELIGYYDIVPFNKLQLYYLRDIFENAIIVILALISINRYYIPLNNKCKYLSIINSDFNDAYNLKKKKMISFSIFGIIYGLILICADFLEFQFINKYLQNNSLHVVREIISVSIFNFVLMIILLPKKLPYLFTEETDLLKTKYLLSDLKEKNILEINDKDIKNIKKQLDKNENIKVVLVNPFFEKKNPNEKFDELHIGNVTADI